MTAAAAGEAPTAPGRRLPPIAQLAVASMAMVVIGGINLAAHLPRRPPLGVPAGLLVAACVLLIGNVVALSQLREFAWNTFFLVTRWALLAYLVIAGMLEYVFVLDHTRGRVLLVLTLMLVVFAVDIPMLLGFSVARYQPVGQSAEQEGTSSVSGQRPDGTASVTGHPES
jgi:hypothetical protein